MGLHGGDPGAAKGHRLHTITTASAKSGGFGDRIQATMVFEKLA